MKQKTDNLLKKMLTMIVTMTLMFCYSAIPSFAADPTGSIKVTNVETGATVTAYQLVQKADNGGWETVNGVSIADIQNPTADEITAIARNVGSLQGIALSASGAVTQSDGIDVTSYSKDGLDPGMYLVLVNKTNSAFVYNPMIVSVNYDKLNGEVDANSTFTVGDSTAYAKRTKPTLDKVITNSSQNENGDTMAAGDTAEFKITTTIPAYSDAYDNNKLKFEVSDTVSEGLDNPTDIVVKEGSKTLTEGVEYELDTSGGKTFVVKFKKDYLLSGNAKSITITYKAKLNENATSGFDANTNTATVTYSNNPSETESKEEKTYHYTFDIDGSVFGSQTGKEIIKVGRDETTGDLITLESESTSTTPLAGAVFGLFKKSDNSKIGEVTTDSAGLIKFTKLDAGEYYLQELQAPTGYTTDSTKIDVVIAANLNADGTLASYTVTIAGKNTTTYTASYAGTEITVTDDTNTSLFNNYKAGLLPSTGGSGIYFYIATGIILILIAIALYVHNRRKETE